MAISFLLASVFRTSQNINVSRLAAQGFTWQSNIALHCIIDPLGVFESYFHHCFPLSCPSGGLVDLNWIFRRQLLGRFGEGSLKMDF